MTTTIIVHAHCSADKEVFVAITDGDESVEEFVLQDGESADRAVYDGRELRVKERMR